MSVLCLQIVDGEPSHETLVAPPVEGMSDDEILRVKAASADEKGWDVEWLDERSFVARKVRWIEERLCERHFQVT